MTKMYVALSIAPKPDRHNDRQVSNNQTEETAMDSENLDTQATWLIQDLEEVREEITRWPEWMRFIIELNQQASDIEDEKAK